MAVIKRTIAPDAKLTKRPQATKSLQGRSWGISRRTFPEWPRRLVTVKPGIEILNPMRVVPNGSGSETIFTLFQPPGMSNEKFAEDAAFKARP